MLSRIDSREAFTVDECFYHELTLQEKAEFEQYLDAWIESGPMPEFCNLV